MTDTTPTTTATTVAKAKRTRTPQTYRLARYLDESDDMEIDDILALVQDALEKGNGVLVELDRPEGLEEGASKANIQSKVKTSVRKNSLRPSPYVGQGRLTVVSYTEPKEPKLVEKQVATVTEVEW
jgi:hypothetical protein